MQLDLNDVVEFVDGCLIGMEKNISPQSVALINPFRRQHMYVFGVKQNWEEYYVSFNFVRVIANDTEIVSSDVIVYDAQGAIVTETIIDAEKTLINGAKIFVFVRGGSEQTYKLTCRITCANGEKYEEDAELSVIEK